ncbi:MAG: hypothetical protein ABJA67_13700 [Chthonomonadales bacterium]
MENISDPLEVLLLRIRFAGSPGSETFRMGRGEIARLHKDWKAFLGGSNVSGGDYMSQDTEHNIIISLNFDQICYIEPGKLY